MAMLIRVLKTWKVLICVRLSYELTQDNHAINRN